MANNDDTDILSGRELNNTLDKAVTRGLREMEKANRSGQDKPVKILGLFEVDPGIAGLFDGIWNAATTELVDVLKPRTYKVTQSVGKSLGLSGGVLNAVTAGVVFGVNVGATASQYATQIFNGWQKHSAARADIARRVAPVLDEMQGNHSVTAFLKAGKTNSVIGAHLKRMNTISHTENSNNMLKMAVNIAWPVVTALPDATDMWKGVYNPKKSAERARAARLAERDESVGGALQRTGKTLINGVSGPIANNIIQKNEKRLQEKLKACSALEVILELDKQVESNPKSSSFSLPRNMAGRSLPLDQYIAKIIVLHHAELADQDPNQSELREALLEDLMHLVKPVAEAIRNGELSPLALVRLVGEEKIVKNGGRALASPEDVAQTIEELGGHVKAATANAKEFYKERPFTPQQFKQAMHVLEGEERLRLGAMVSDEVLKEAGVSSADIKAMREYPRAAAEEALASSILGLAAEGDEALKTQGLPTSSIRKLHELKKAIEHKGVEALRDATLHADTMLLDAAVPQIVAGDKHYLGTVAGKGQSLTESLANKAAERVEGFSARESMRRDHAMHHGKEF